MEQHYQELMLIILSNDAPYLAHRYVVAHNLWGWEAAERVIIQDISLGIECHKKYSLTDSSLNALRQHIVDEFNKLDVVQPDGKRRVDIRIIKEMRLRELQGATL